LNKTSNVLSFICSTTYDIFVHGTIFHLQHAGAMAAVVCDDAVLKQAKNNLSSEQKELLLWHYRLGHIGISRVQSLLQKPRTNSFNDKQSRIISPSNITTGALIVTLLYAPHVSMLSKSERILLEVQYQNRSPLLDLVTTFSMQEIGYQSIFIVHQLMDVCLIHSGRRIILLNSPVERSLWITLLDSFITLISIQLQPPKLSFRSIYLKTTVTPLEFEFANMLPITILFMAPIGQTIVKINVNLISCVWCWCSSSKLCREKYSVNF
jgi:hypothetical protein